MAALLVLLAVLVFLTVDYFVQRRHHFAPAVAPEGVTPAPLAMHVPSYRTPQGVYFDRGHAWAFLEESGDALVGVDDVVKTVIGQVDRVETAPVGTKVRKGDQLIELFHGNRSVVVESPFDGVVAGVNNARETDSDSRPFIADWLCAVRPKDTSLLQQTMLLGEKAGEWIRREARRLRVFVSTIAPDHPLLAQTMHDGGMPYAGLAEYLSDEDWHKFRETFFHHREDANS